MFKEEKHTFSKVYVSDVSAEFQKVNTCVPSISRSKHRALLEAQKPLPIPVTTHAHQPS